MKNCCRYHNKFQYKDIDLEDCGVAGQGAVVLCCPNCPEKSWYDKNQPTRPVEYYVDDILEGITYEAKNKVG